VNTQNGTFKIIVGVYGTDPAKVEEEIEESVEANNVGLRSSVGRLFYRKQVPTMY
jgi:hypothetical protein